MKALKAFGMAVVALVCALLVVGATVLAYNAAAVVVSVCTGWWLLLLLPLVGAWLAFTAAGCDAISYALTHKRPGVRYDSVDLDKSVEDDAA